MHPGPFLIRRLKISTQTKYVFRALLGILFLLSATAKLAGIDAFEIYLFSFGWFSLGASFLLARLVIAAEYALGILLLANFYPRLAFWGAFALLAGFTGFLVFLALRGDRGNCNCFGEWVSLSPVQSIWKNLGMLALLAPSAGIPAFRLKRKPLLLALFCLIPLAAVLIASPPDNWRYGSYGGDKLLNEPVFREALARGTLPASVAEGDRVVCFYSLKCPFCKLSAQKIAMLRQRGEFSRAPVILVIGRGEDTDTEPFLEGTGLVPDEIHFIEPADFLRITNGGFPVILVLHEGEILEKYNYRNLH